MAVVVEVVVAAVAEAVDAAAAEVVQLVVGMMASLAVVVEHALEQFEVVVVMAVEWLGGMVELAQVVEPLEEADEEESEEELVPHERLALIHPIQSSP